MVKKKRVNKKSNSSTVSRKDFETFEFGVQRLKELEKELNSLDTRGFSGDAQDIKSRLKNVSEIPTIEKKLKILRLKIDKKFNPSKKRKSVIKKDIRSIKEDIPEIKSAIRRLGKKVDESQKKKKTSIDSGVGNLVDTDFNVFLTQVKASLSERIRSREKDIEDVLKVDLQKREQKYHDKYSNLSKEFNNKKEQLEKEMAKKYNIRIQGELKKEVAEKFNAELNKKLDAEKVRLSKQYVAQLKEHAHANLEKRKSELKKQFEKEFTNKVIALENRKRNEEKKLEKEKNFIDRLRDSITRRKEEEIKRTRERLTNEFHSKLAKEIISRESAIRAQLRNEYELKLKKSIQDHEANMKKKKLALELEMQRKMRQVLS